MLTWRPVIAWCEQLYMKRRLTWIVISMIFQWQLVRSTILEFHRKLEDLKLNWHRYNKFRATLKISRKLTDYRFDRLCWNQLVGQLNQSKWVRQSPEVLFLYVESVSSVNVKWEYELTNEKKADHNHHGWLATYVMVNSN